MTNSYSKVKYIVAAIFLALATYNISKTTLEIYKNSSRVEDLQTEAEAEMEENQGLKEELAFAQTDEFVEREARNKLNLIKPGEQVLIPVDSDLKLGSETAVVLGDKRAIIEGNFSLWYNLFFDTK